MTLVELLVTVVILVTLLAGVLPLVSPNNDSRKIREGSRQLVSLLTQAQAQAARDGRSVGVSYTEVKNWTDLDNDGERDDGEVTGNGMALEAFIVAEPPPFTGYSSDSAVGFVTANVDVNNDGNLPDFWAPLSASTPLTLLRPGDPPLVNIAFGNGVGGEGMTCQYAAPADVTDGIPANMFRGAVLKLNTDSGYWEARGTGDVIQVGKELFEILLNDFDDVDDADNVADVDPPVALDELTGGEFLRAQKVLTVRWLTWRGRPTMAEPGMNVNQTMLPRGGRSYRIRRQPTSTVSPSRTTAEAIQFPRNVGIDMDPDLGNRSLSIVFSPNGSVEAIFRDGRKEDEIRPVFILLGRAENANTPTPPATLDEFNSRYDFRGSIDDDELAERRTQVNLLNGDSRWVVVTPAGRILTAENALFDPRTESVRTGDPGHPFYALEGIALGDAPALQRERQRVLAQQFARNYEAEAGN